MFVVFRQELNQVKSQRLTDEERKKQNKQVRKKYRTKFCRLLHLIPKQTETIHNSSCPPPAERKPVKTLHNLIKLYKVLLAQLESASEVKLCKKLKKMFKDRKSDIELLLQNNEDKLAKQLIVCTSKILLTKYVI